MKGGSVVTHGNSFLQLEDITRVIKDTVVEGGESGAEGQVAELASEVVAVGLQVEGVSQPQVDDL